MPQAGSVVAVELDYSKYVRYYFPWNSKFKSGSVYCDREEISAKYLDTSPKCFHFTE